MGRTVSIGAQSFEFIRKNNYDLGVKRYVLFER